MYCVLYQKDNTGKCTGGMEFRMKLVNLSSLYYYIGNK